ncbi:MAG TPA: hypothetical protein VIM58_11930, partial [Candidatus Methylacidiphilales bacterium]
MSWAGAFQGVAGALLLAGAGANVATAVWLWKKRRPVLVPISKSLPCLGLLIVLPGLAMFAYFAWQGDPLLKTTRELRDWLWVLGSLAFLAVLICAWSLPKARGFQVVGVGREAFLRAWERATSRMGVASEVPGVQLLCQFPSRFAVFSALRERTETVNELAAALEAEFIASVERSLFWPAFCAGLGLAQGIVAGAV